MEVVLEEADEALYWLTISKIALNIDIEKIEPLINEATELVRIFNATEITAKKNRNGSKSQNS